MACCHRYDNDDDSTGEGASRNEYVVQVVQMNGNGHLQVQLAVPVAWQRFRNCFQNEFFLTSLASVAGSTGAVEGVDATPARAAVTAWIHAACGSRWNEAIRPCESLGALAGVIVAPVDAVVVVVARVRVAEVDLDMASLAGVAASADAGVAADVIHTRAAIDAG